MKKKKINWIYNSRPYETASNKKYLLCVNKFGQLIIREWKAEYDLRTDSLIYTKHNYIIDYDILRTLSVLELKRFYHQMKVKSFIMADVKPGTKYNDKEIQDKAAEYCTYHPLFLSEESFDDRIHEIDDDYPSDSNGQQTD